jgi:hypothetical protein
MASKIFLDANILLDFLLKRADYTDSKKIIQLVIDKKLMPLSLLLLFILLRIGS